MPRVGNSKSKSARDNIKGGKQISKSSLSRSSMRELVVKELTPSLKDDFLLFFDSVAFADNPDWSDCYCSAYHFANKGKTESRREASSLIEEDRMHGLLAYDNGKPVGWCNAAPRSSYPGVQWLMGPGPDQAERIGSIVCCRKFSQKGLEFAEAYPVKKPQSAAYNFPGPLSMYLKNGFSPHHDADWYLVVRKRLETPV